MFNLQEMPWTDVKEALKTTKTALIPIGAVEVDGPYLPQGTDGIVATYFSNKLAERITSFVVPLIPVGVCPEADDFPITLSVSPATLGAYVGEICDSLVKHGINRIIFVSGHRTNVPALEENMVRLRDKGVKSAIIFTWDLMFSISKDLAESDPPNTHGGEFCTSVVMAIDENLVPTERFEKTTPKKRIGSGVPGVYIYQKFSDLSDVGVMGDPRKASKEKGLEMLKRGLDKAEEFIVNNL